MYMHDENPWMNYIIYSSVPYETMHTRGCYAVSFNFNSFAIVYSSHTNTQCCVWARCALNKVNLFFGNWNLFLIDSWLVVVAVILLLLSLWTVCCLVYFWCDRKRYGSALPLMSFECTDCFTHCSIFHFIHIFLTVFSLSLSPSLSSCILLFFTIGWHSNAGV